MRLLVLGLLLVCGVAVADQPVRRHVIALMPGAGPDPETEDAVHQLLELPLNYLGMVVDRHYLGKGPPPAGELKNARAVLTWFDSGQERVPWLWPWLKRVVWAHKLRVIHFGEFGPLQGPELPAWLQRFGLEYDDYFAGGPLGIRVSFSDERACRFEADPRGLAVHRGPRSTGLKNHVWVATRLLASGDLRTPVVSGPWGAVALDPWTLRAGSGARERRWHLDPFRFFKEALGLERVPAPHPSVLNGRRMLFIQIDGDGFESLSTARRNALAARVMKDEVLERYKLPFTVSVIIRSLTPDYRVEKPTPAMQLAREILNLPGVEPASHGVLHTLKWQRPLEADSPPRTIVWYPSMKNYEYSPVAEVRESIRFINQHLMAPGRKCRVMLWTGAANPLAGPVDAARQAGCWNVNGGVFRWDAWQDSVGYVSPWGRRVGETLQVYAGAANENDFEGFFDTMPGAYRHIDTTIERTGAPRILKPADLYFHFYSAATPARLQSIHALMRRWALSEPTAPVHASVYAQAVTSAVETARILRTSRGWVFSDFGGCRSVRIDDEARSIDWRASRGLLGARRLRESLYLHLAQGDAELVFAPEPQRYPHVKEANCLLHDGVLAADGVHVTASGFHRRVVIFTGFLPDSTVTVTLDGKAAPQLTNAQGELTVTLPEPGRTRIQVEAGRD